MRNYTLFFIIGIFFSLPALAQQGRKSILYTIVTQKKQSAVAFQNIQLFSTAAPTGKITVNNVSYPILDSTRLKIDKAAVINTIQSKPEAITLSVPFGNFHTYVLDLTEEKINVSGDFSFGTINEKGNQLKTSTDQGVHYRGYVEGDSSSVATISFFANGEVMGMFANSEGNFNIGRTDSSGDNYIVFNDKDLTKRSPFKCGTGELPRIVPPNHSTNTESANTTNTKSTSSVPALLCKKVRVYLEGSYNLYNYNFHSNLTATQNYLLGIFNIVSTLYQNEGIMVELSQTYVWTTPDSYDTTNSLDAMLDFEDRWNNLNDTFNGDVAQLVAGGTTENGGIASLLPSLCYYRPFNYSYSNVDGYYYSLPTFSWDATVITHELGHTFSSHHTHWCGWNLGPNGTCGSIDNCATDDPSDSCTTCPAQTNINALPPGWKGTIMSYCHLRNNIGVNLANGFGPLPQAAIRNGINSSTCITGTVESWSGTTSTAWENSANWSCGKVPDSNTDVSIKQGASNYPAINSAAQCHTLTAPSGTSLKVVTGHSLNISGTGTVLTH